MRPGRFAFAAAVIGAASLVCAWSSSAAPAGTRAAGPSTSASVPEPGPSDMAAGKAVFEAVCSECHEAAFATQMRNNSEGWRQIVDRMVSHGMEASAEQKAQIIDYLAKAYPPGS